MILNTTSNVVIWTLEVCLLDKIFTTKIKVYLDLCMNSNRHYDVYWITNLHKVMLVGKHGI